MLLAHVMGYYFQVITCYPEAKVAVILDFTQSNTWLENMGVKHVACL